VVPLIIVGKNSRLYALAKPLLSEHVRGEYSHREEIDPQHIKGATLVVFSLGPTLAANTALFRRLELLHPEHLVYVSSTSALVGSSRLSLRYPRLKYLCEQSCIHRFNAAIVRVGLLPDQVPGRLIGRTLVSNVTGVANAITDAAWPASKKGGTITNAFSVSEFPPTTLADRVLLCAYGLLYSIFGGFPLVLRPLDVILRRIGFRNYGYTFAAAKKHGAL
jgi:hypothetical protein